MTHSQTMFIVAWLLKGSLGSKNGFYETYLWEGVFVSALFYVHAHLRVLLFMQPHYGSTIKNNATQPPGRP